MGWFTSNWIWIGLIGAMVAMHLRHGGHGGHGRSHKGHGGGDSLRSDESSRRRSRTARGFFAAPRMGDRDHHLRGGATDRAAFVRSRLITTRIRAASAIAVAVTAPVAAMVIPAAGPVRQSNASISTPVEATAVTTSTQKVRRTRRISAHPRWEAGVVRASIMVRTTMALRTSKPSATATGRLRHHRCGLRSTNGTAISSANRAPDP